MLTLLCRPGFINIEAMSVTAITDCRLRSQCLFIIVIYWPSEAKSLFWLESSAFCLCMCLVISQLRPHTYAYRHSIWNQRTSYKREKSDVFRKQILFQNGGCFVVLFRSYNQTTWPILIQFRLFLDILIVPYPYLLISLSHDNSPNGTLTGLYLSRFPRRWPILGIEHSILS